MSKNKTLIVLLVMLSAIVLQATVIGDVAAKMKPGTFMMLKNDLTYDLMHTGWINDYIWAYASECSWDPVSQQLMFVGAPHGVRSMFIVYDAKTDHWREELTCREPPVFANTFNHAYDMRTMDTDSGIYWVHTFNQGPAGHYLFNYYPSENRWDSMLTTGTWTTSNMNSIGYFPDKKCIIAYSGWDGSVRRLDPQTRAWSQVGAGQAGGFDVVIQYNSRFHCMVFGGGGGGTAGALYKLDTNFQVTPLPFCDRRIGCMNAELVCDPGTGDVIVFDGTKIRALDMEAKTWRGIALSPAALSSMNLTGANAIMGTIPELNVHVILNTSAYNVLLYKHSADSLVDAEKGSVRAAPAGALCASPNPFRSAVTLTFPDQGRFDICDMKGRIVGSASVNKGAWRWNAKKGTGDPAVPGVYACRFKGKNGAQSVIRLVVLP